MDQYLTKTVNFLIVNYGIHSLVFLMTVDMVDKPLSKLMHLLHRYLFSIWKRVFFTNQEHGQLITCFLEAMQC